MAPLGLAGFRLLFLATLGSSVGTFLAAIALAIDVKDRTNSGLWVGAVLVVAYLPTVVVGLTLGPLLDRLPRRNLMVGADVLRAAVFFALPFTSSPGAIVALAAVAGIANGFFRPAVYAGVPNLVSDEDLPAANALVGRLVSRADRGAVSSPPPPAPTRRTGSTAPRSSSPRS